MDIPQLIKSSLVILLMIQSGWSYRQDITEAGEKSFCTYRKHLTFKPAATCCNNQVIKPALLTDENWDQCQLEVKENTIEKIGWAMYICLLKKASSVEELSLQAFGDLITKDYPDDIKSKINDEIQKQTVDAAPLSLGEYKKLDKIRVTYYDIEEAVCEGTTGGSYGNTDAKCSFWKEENHRAGMCCKNAYPVDIKYRTLMDLGDPVAVDKACRAKYHEEFMAMNISNTYDSLEATLFEMCAVACAMDGKENWNFKGGIFENHYFWEFNVSKELLARQHLFLPRYFDDALVAPAFQYVISTFSINDTIADMKNYTFADAHPHESNTPRSVHFSSYVHVMKNRTIIDADDIITTTIPPNPQMSTTTKRYPVEFAQRPFHRGFMHIPVLCSSYNQIVTLLEYFLFEQKRNCEGSEPEEEPKPETAPPADESTVEPPAEAQRR